LARATSGDSETTCEEPESEHELMPIKMNPRRNDVNLVMTVNFLQKKRILTTWFMTANNQKNEYLSVEKRIFWYVDAHFSPQ
jgi:hypothetical protein